MATFRRRLVPGPSIVRVGAACVLLIYSWSILNLLREVPAWILYLSSWDLLGIVAYTQAFALFESALVVAFLLALAFVLPGSLLREDFVPRGTALILLTAGAAVAAHYSDELLSLPETRAYLVIAAAYALAVVGAHLLLRRSAALKSALSAFADRVTVLLYVYLPLSALALVVVLVRQF